MTANALLQLAFYVVVLIALAKPLGTYMARIYEGQPAFLNRIGAPFERLIYRVCGVDETADMRWTQYALAMLEGAWRSIKLADSASARSSTKRRAPASLVADSDTLSCATCASSR